MKLTDRVIQSLKWSGRTLDIHWCSVVKGLGVRVYKTGRTCYVLAYNELGTYKVRTLAPCTEMTLKEAQAEATKIIVRSERRTKLRLEYGPSVTFEGLANLWVNTYAKQHKSSWKQDVARLKLHILPAIGRDSLAGINTLQLVQLHARISEKAPYQANRVIVLIRTIFNQASKWGTWTGPNPAKAVALNRERPRDRWVTESEMPALGKALGKEQNHYARSAILLYLLTGTRKSEVMNAKWADIDFEQKLWTIRKNKSDRTYYKELSSIALTVLAAVPRQEDNPYVFCGKRKGRPLVNISKPWYRICEEANLVGVRVHDLRHTFASWLANSDYSLILIAKAMDHASPKTTARYAHLKRRKVSDAVEVVSRKIFRSLKLEFL